MTTRTETSDSFALLDFAPGACLEHDESAPLPFAVWLDGDIIGAGEAPSEAVEEARKTVRGWESSR